MVGGRLGAVLFRVSWRALRRASTHVETLASRAQQGHHVDGNDAVAGLIEGIRTVWSGRFDVIPPSAILDHVSPQVGPFGTSDGHAGPQRGLTDRMRLVRRRRQCLDAKQTEQRAARFGKAADCEGRGGRSGEPLCHAVVLRRPSLQNLRRRGLGEATDRGRWGPGGQADRRTDITDVAGCMLQREGGWPMAGGSGGSGECGAAEGGWVDGQEIAGDSDSEGVFRQGAKRTLQEGCGTEGRVARHDATVVAAWARCRR